MISTMTKKFINKIEFTDSCWLWKANKLKKGYGLFNTGKKMVQSHRHIWIHYFGEIPNGMLVCHKCDTPSCVNPSHLFLGSSQDNATDMINKGRHSYGERNGQSKLTFKEVDEIRKLYVRGEGGVSSEFSMRGLAKKYDISPSIISRIINKQRWNYKNVEDVSV